RALRPGLGERLGGESQRLPAERDRHARPPLPDLRRRRPLRLRPLEAGAAAALQRRPGPGLDRRQPRRELLRLGPRAAGADPAGPDRTGRRPRGGPDRGADRMVPQPRARRLDWTAMSGFWTIFFLLVVLKIPVFGSLWLVWWAVQSKPETEELP